MSKSISHIGKSIVRAALVAALGLATVGGTAYADLRKDHPRDYPPELIAKAKLHEAAMNSGKDHYAAFEAAGRPDTSAIPERLVSKSQKHLEEMNQGKDHAAASK